MIMTHEDIVLYYLLLNIMILLMIVFTLWILSTFRNTITGMLKYLMEKTIQELMKALL